MDDQLNDQQTDPEQHTEDEIIEQIKLLMKTLCTDNKEQDKKNLENLVDTIYESVLQKSKLEAEENKKQGKPG